jgi:hypothetical protein
MKELTKAIHNNNLEEVKNIIENNSNIDINKWDGYYIRTAIEKGFFEIVKYFVEELEMSLVFYNKKNYTISLATKENVNYKLVKYLIEKGFSFDEFLTKSNKVCSDFSDACRSDNLEKVKDIIAVGFSNNTEFSVWVDRAVKSKNNTSVISFLRTFSKKDK